MNVGVLLREKEQRLLSCSKTDLVTACINKMNEHKVGALVVIDPEGQIEGIVTERDVLRTIDKHRAMPAYLTTADIMTPKNRLITAGKEQTVENIMEVMTEHRIRHLPVMENGKVTGLVSIGDVVRFQLQAVLVDNESMKKYISGQ